VLFYLDRFPVESELHAGLDELMVIGDADREQVMQAVVDATGSAPHLLTPNDVGLDLQGQPISFDSIAAASGPAILAWK
jgi:hypothetical protein